MSFPTPYITIKNTTWSHLVTYMIYQNKKLHILHPDKKLALNIPEQSLLPFIQEVKSNLTKNLQKDFSLFQILSFEFLAKHQNLKPKKHRTNLLPEAIFLIPSQSNNNPEQILDIQDYIKLPPQTNRIYTPPHTPDKKHFLNQIQQLQKRLSKPSNFNQKFIQDNQIQEENLYKNINSKGTNLLLKTPDFSILGNLKEIPNIPNLNQEIEYSLKLESHPRNFQNGLVIHSTSTQENLYQITNSIESIQNNLYTNITQPIKQSSKPFDLYKKAISKNKSLIKTIT